MVPIDNTEVISYSTSIDPNVVVAVLEIFDIKAIFQKSNGEC